MLSHKAKYALRALMVLAKEFNHGPLLIADIAQKGSLPKKFLELILLELKNAGVLHSRKGKGGGYSLARNPFQISLIDILRTSGGPVALVPCVSQTAYSKCEECPDEAVCGIRQVMLEIHQQTIRILSQTSLGELVEREQTALHVRDEAVMYHI